MMDEVEDFVVGKDVKCPMCGGEMKKYGSYKGKSKFSCIICKYEI